jgi:hypothetical protein
MKKMNEFLKAAEHVPNNRGDKERLRLNKKLYFSYISPQQHALSRHLTIIQQQNYQFVADYALSK